MTAPVPTFDLTRASKTLFNKIAVPPAAEPDNPPGIQSVCFDNVHNRMYTLQSFDGAAGNMYLSWLDMSKNGATQSQYMTLLGFGHGQEFGVVVDGADTWIWVECDGVLYSSGNAFGSKIGRFKWAPGTTINSFTAPASTLIKYDLKPDSIALGCCIDKNTVLVNFNRAGVNFIQAYSMSDLIANGNASAPIGQEIRVMKYQGTMQGRGIFGDFCYSIAGDAKASYCSDMPEVHLYWQNIWDGSTGNALTVAGPDLPRREPEGITVQTVGSVHRLVYSFATRKDCTGTGKNLVSFFYIDDVPVAPPLPPATFARSSTGTGGPLGCANTYRVFAFDRGGQDRIGEITPLTSLTWSRVRDDISTATIETNGFGTDCCDLLNSLRSMRHELVIFRDGVRVWEGPITRIAYQYDHVEIEARDVMQYLYRRILRPGYNHTYQSNATPKGGPYPHGNPVTNTIESIIHITLTDLGDDYFDSHPNYPEIYNGGDDPNILRYLTVYKYSDDARESRLVYPFQKTLWEEIDDLAQNAGVDYVTVGRRIIVWDTSRAIGRTNVMTDADFMADPIITEYGMNLATFAAVTDGQGNYGVTANDQSYYGRVEMLTSTYSSTTGPSKDGIPSQLQLLQLQSAYYQAKKLYQHFPCLSAAEAARLAAYQKERATPGVKPERQKVLDALIKPLNDRKLDCARLKSKMNTAYSKYRAAVKAHDKYQDQYTAYIRGMTTQAMRNISGRNPSPLVVRIPDNSQLNPNVMLGINDLIPGIWIPLRSNATCRQFQQWQKLDTVNVNWSSDSGIKTETVTVSMSPAPQSGQDPDADDNDPDAGDE